MRIFILDAPVMPTQQRKTMTRGFTLLEVVFASSILFILFMALFESLLFCRRSAADLKGRLAADAIAYDIAWEYFNRKTTWFETFVTSDKSTWVALPADRSSAFMSNGTSFASYNLTLLREPAGSGPITHWRIITNVRWPRLGGGWSTLATPYEIERHRVERNLFRSGL